MRYSMMIYSISNTFVVWTSCDTSYLYFIIIIQKIVIRWLQLIPQDFIELYWHSFLKFTSSKMKIKTSYGLWSIKEERVGEIELRDETMSEVFIFHHISRSAIRSRKNYSKSNLYVVQSSIWFNLVEKRIVSFDYSLLSESTIEGLRKDPDWILHIIKSI